MSTVMPAVIIDNGSYSIKAGFSCDNHPLSVFRTIVGRPKFVRNGYGYGNLPYEIYIGDEGFDRREELDLSSPVSDGRITHWDNMERIWHHIYYRELKVAPEEQAVLLTCSNMMTIEEKTKICEIFFNTLNAPAVSIQPQSVLALYGSGYTTGICVNLGYSTTDISPVYEGRHIGYANMQTGIASVQINNFIKNSFEKRGYDFKNDTLNIIENIKKDYLYLTKNCAMSRKNHSRKYKLANGQDFEVGQEAFMAAELLFNPELVTQGNEKYRSLQKSIVTAVLKCDPDLREELYGAIVVCGGLAAIPGLFERLGLEVEKLSGGTQVKVISSSETYAVAWLGGATFAGLPDAAKMWIQKEEFEDNGERMIRKKFL